MNIPAHAAIYTTNAASKEQLMQQLESMHFPEELQFLNGLKGFVFTGSTLLDFIKEELRHELYFVKPVNGISLATSSEGEQKKAMLYYLLKQSPAWLLIDEIFDNLDIATQAQVQAAITEAAANTVIIQLFVMI